MCVYALLKNIDTFICALMQYFILKY